MKVTMTGSLTKPSLVKVEYWKTHFGHELQLGHISLSSNTRAEIAGKLKEGVSFNHILDTIRDNVYKESNERLLILERKDLHNITRDFNIDYSTKRHQDDAISVKMWVSEMQANEDNPVVYYKGQNEEDTSTLLKQSDFVLIIMTSFQAEQFSKFGENKICIDGTHGTNAYDIQLYTIMCVDEFGTGCPVAYCFSNRSDEYIFTLFFDKLKEKIGIIKSSIFMSDDAPAFYNAWVSVMGKVDHRLLCSWHIDKNWRKNLNKIGDVNKKSLVYKTLKVLQITPNKIKFQSSLIQIIKQLDCDDDTKSFGSYFKTHYANRAETWAYCFRKGLGINTNMYLESYHKILKHIYLEGRKVKRLDKTINAVLKVARDSLFKRLINITKNKTTEKIQQINTSHKASQGISINSIQTIEKDKHWLVSSSKNTLVQYHVTFIQATCTIPCLACPECKVCIHTFECSCNDNTIKLNICKHIHACVRENLIQNLNTEQLPTFSETKNDEVSKLLRKSQNLVPNISKNEMLIKKFECIIGILSRGNDVSPEDYSKIERHADNAIKLLNKDAIVIKTTEKVNVQQKVVQQHRLYSTKAKKKKSELKFNKPSLAEETVIKDGLAHNTSEIVNIHTSFDHTYL